MVRPYLYQASQLLYFLHLNEQQALTLSKSRGEWGQEEILQQNCSRFVAAPDRDDSLHIIAADSSNKLYHIIVTQDQVQTKPFLAHENSGPFLFSFSKDGMGYFFYTEDITSGKLRAAKYSAALGWKEEVVPEQSCSIPVSLAADNSGGIHLLLYDLTNDSLNYHFRSERMKKWTDPFCLDRAVQLSLLPALWVTAEHNIHTAWFLPQKNMLCYQVKKAGGWPVGGWQREQYLTLHTEPSLVSFHEESENVKIWCIGTDSKLNVFSPQNGNWQQITKEAIDCLPVRHGKIGGELYDLTDTFPPTDLFFSKISTQITREHAREQNNEQVQNLLDQIMKLREEKNSIQELLRKKEESVAQYRLMLEHSGRQRSEYEAKSEARLSEMEEECRQCQDKNKSLSEQLKQVQKKLAAKEATVKDHQMETGNLRLELTKSMQQKEDLLAAVQKTAEEYRTCHNENKSLTEQLEQVQKESALKEAAIKDHRMETDTLRLELTKSKQVETDLRASVRNLEREYRKCQNENKLLKEQFKQVQMKLSANCTETDALRLEMTKSRQQEADLRATIRKMEKEMEQGFLSKILSVFKK
jgi:predicted  nucleic acid-binding Zn-ribbon protein